MNVQNSSVETTLRPIVVALVLFGCAAAVITHAGTLIASGLNPISSPVGALAWTDDGTWFSYGLWLFAFGHAGLVFLLNRPGAGRFTRGAQFFLLLNAVLIFWLPSYFGSVSPTELPLATAGPLWLLGGGVGFAMTCAAIAIWRSHRSMAFMTLVCLLLWSLLAPVFFAIDPGWIGAYQRSVGIVLLVWTAALAIRLGFPARANW